MLELDVRLTKDGQVVVFHDPDLKRLVGLPKAIAEMDYDQLPPLPQTIPIDTIPGKHLFSITYYLRIYYDPLLLMTRRGLSNR